MTRLLRSILFVPGSSPDRFGKAEAAGADAVVFDLEDSVATERKDAARVAIAEWLSRGVQSPPLRIVRINAASTPTFDDDLDWLQDAVGLDAVMLPKAEDAWAIDRVAAVAPSLMVVPLIETARGVLNAFAMTGAKPTMPAFAFGGEDLTAQIGIARTIGGEELLFARSQVVLAATAVGAVPIDGVLIDIVNDEILRRDARRARALGFGGKLAVHPSQVPVINEVFSPTADEIAEAERIVAAYEDAVARGAGVTRLDDRMIDSPVVARARKMIDVARRIRTR